jgi:hypothetical protein
MAHRGVKTYGPGVRDDRSPELLKWEASRSFRYDTRRIDASGRMIGSHNGKNLGRRWLKVYLRRLRRRAFRFDTDIEIRKAQDRLNRLYD